MDYEFAKMQAVAELAVAEVLKALGVHSGELSRSAASRTYGRWFDEAVAAGRLQPSRVGRGTTGTKWYSVEDILRLKAVDASRASLQIHNSNILHR